MAKIRKVNQYYKKGPVNDIWTGNETEVITLNALNFLQIGIQALPGTQFSFDGVHKITIGNTGIYEINFESFNIVVDKLLIYKNNNYDQNDYLIIDYIYEEEV